MAKLVLLVALSCIAGLALSSPSSKVSSSLLAKLAKDKRANIAIVINSPVSTVFAQYEGQSYPKRGQKMTLLRESLIKYTDATQAPVRSFLTSKGVTFITHWLTNKIFVRDADEALVLELATVLRSSILEVREEIVAHVDPIDPVAAKKPVEPQVVRGVSVVGANKLWEQGNTGEGTIVSSIDTGVRGTHEILAANFLGDYGWYDPVLGSRAPEDEQGHGTHTMGTIAGQEGFGVAPGAKWMACVGCGSFGCSESDLVGCGEFTACPHLTDGSSPDCSRAPHVTSNSWGSTLGGQDWYDDVIAGFKEAGVIPVFSAGNSGSGCRSVGSPGDRSVIGVAATDFEDSIAYFSSRGPAVDGTQKPDVSAPGVEVLSAWYTADDAYSYLSGTSMACPHVSGGVALLIAGNPALEGNYDLVKSVIEENAKQEGLSGGNQMCAPGDDSFPNSHYGHGRLDLVASADGLRK